MAELYQVVDEGDNITGYKTLAEINASKELYRISALWLTNSIKEILIAKRALTKSHDPGVWESAVAGTVEKNETYESNIYKEAEEEIGLTGVEFKKGPKQRMHVFPSFCQWFTATLDQPAEEFVLQKEEVDAVKWISREELIKDATANPQNYVPSILDIVALFEA